VRPQRHTADDRDIVAAMAAHGVMLAGHGAELKGRCPFHEDDSPSLSVNREKGLWHCFGCGASGNVETFLRRIDGAPVAPPLRVVSPSPKPDAFIAAHAEALEVLAGLYHDELKKPRHEAARAYLRSRLPGVTDELIERFRIGFAVAGAVGKISGDLGVGKALREIGAVKGRDPKANGSEHFSGCLVFPIADAAGRTVGMYGRRLGDREPRHLYLPGPHRGIWNVRGIAGAAEVFITEAIIDALALVSLGFDSVTALYGAGGLTDELVSFLAAQRPARIYLAQDADQAGDESAERTAARLRAVLPGASFMRLRPPEGRDLAEWIAGGADADAIRSAMADTSTIAEPAAEPPENDTTMTAGEGEKRRAYRIEWLGANGGKLLCRIRAERIENGAFHIDVFDLSRDRARRGFATRAGARLEIEMEEIERDLLELLARAESTRPRLAEDSPEEEVYRMTAEEEAEALAFLKRVDLLDAIAADIGALGYVGEEIPKRLTYLIAISRKLSGPLAGVIMSQSGVGKSALMEKVAELSPPEEVIVYTRITPQALYYMETRSIAHKLIVFSEEEGLSEAEYSVRELISAKQLRLAATMKDPATGRMRTEEYVVNGPVAMLFSTTSPRIHYENATRFLALSLDESIEQTRRIQAAQRRARTMEGILGRSNTSAIVRRHRNAQRLLEPLPVIIEDVEQIEFPAHWIRTRREHEKFLTVVEALALLYQKQREIRTAPDADESGSATRCIVATRADVETAARLLGDLMRQAIEDMSATSKDLLQRIREMVATHGKKDAGEVRFNRRDVREWTNWSDWQIRIHLKELEELEMILPVMGGGRGREYRYEIAYDGVQAPDVSFGLTAP
jgi:DNA primase catalytic core